MRKFCFAAFAAVLIGTTACTPKAPEQFTGKIVDGTMNTVTVESPADGRRVTFTTEDADMQEAYGLLLGNTATVTYRGKLGETTPALKVVTIPPVLRPSAAGWSPIRSIPSRNKALKFG